MVFTPFPFTVVCVCVCVCVCERERERESVCVCVCYNLTRAVKQGATLLIYRVFTQAEKKSYVTSNLRIYILVNLVES